MQREVQVGTDGVAAQVEALERKRRADTADGVLEVFDRSVNRVVEVEHGPHLLADVEGPAPSKQNESLVGKRSPVKEVLPGDAASRPLLDDLSGRRYRVAVAGRGFSLTAAASSSRMPSWRARASGIPARLEPVISTPERNN